MKTSVVTKEYQNLHKEIARLQEKWKKNLSLDMINTKVDQAALKSGIPVIADTTFNFNPSLSLEWIEELSQILSKYNENLSDKLVALNSMLNEEIAERWIEEAMLLNHLYFIGFAEENHLDEWIPQFMAETTIRPYLQLTAELVQEHIHVATPGAGCPVCGEPVRLAQLEEEGKKALHCPRCLAHWRLNRLTCAHCGNHDHKTINFLTIEEDPASQIQVCEECKGYTKIIDTRQYLNKPTASLLDLSSIHLDIIAQENGYNAVGDKNQKN